MTHPSHEMTEAPGNRSENPERSAYANIASNSWNSDNMRSISRATSSNTMPAEFGRLEIFESSTTTERQINANGAAANNEEPSETVAKVHKGGVAKTEQIDSDVKKYPPYKKYQDDDDTKNDTKDHSTDKTPKKQNDEPYDPFSNPDGKKPVKPIDPNTAGDVC
jgi:hypothetical protein